MKSHTPAIPGFNNEEGLQITNLQQEQNEQTATCALAPLGRRLLGERKISVSVLLKNALSNGVIKQT